MYILYPHPSILTLKDAVQMTRQDNCGTMYGHSQLVHGILSGRQMWPSQLVHGMLFGTQMWGL